MPRNARLYRFLTALGLLALILPLTTLPDRQAQAQPQSPAPVAGTGSPADAAVLSSGSSIRINEVMPKPETGAYEWVELFNCGYYHLHFPLGLRSGSGLAAVNPAPPLPQGEQVTTSGPVDISGWQVTDEDGNDYTIPEALPAVPPGTYVLIYFDGQGSAADDYDLSDGLAVLHSPPGLVDPFEGGADQVALYTSTPHVPGTIVGFVAWGADPSPDDSNAAAAGVWGKGLYKSLREIGDETPQPVYPGRSLGLLPGDADTYATESWVHYQVAEATPGAGNPVPRIANYDPISGATIDSATFAIGWPWVEGATAYHFQMDDNSDFASPEYDLTLDSPSFVPDSPVPDGMHYWRVAVIQGALNGPWSAPAEINNLTYPGGAHGDSTPGTDQVTLGLSWRLQRKDTGMVCRAGDHETGDLGSGATKNAPWDAPHPMDDGPKEHGSQYCERACISMLAEYYGGNLSQDRIAYADYMGTGDDLGHADPNTTYIDYQLDWAGIPAARHGGKPDFATMKAWIDEQHPLITLSPGHFRVVDGYRESGTDEAALQQIHFLDPLKHANDPGHPDELGLWRNWSDEPITAVWVGASGPGGAPSVVSDEDLDSDGIVDTRDDSDGDGLVDFDEYSRFGTDRMDPDSDNDGVPDKLDMREYVFNEAGWYKPRLWDRDGDGLSKDDLPPRKWR